MTAKRNNNKSELTYPLSDNSKKATEDFKTANRLASAIYSVFKKLLERSAGRKQYQRLNKLILKIMHGGAQGGLGTRKLYQGNVGLLKGFRLNAYTLWDSLIHCQPVIAISAQEQLLRIHLQKIEDQDVHVPSRVSKLVLQFVCCEVDVDKYIVNSYLSAKLILPLKTGGVLSNAKKMTMHLPNMEGKVLLVLLIVRMYLQEGHTDGELAYTATEFLSNDRKYYAGEILEAFYVKDGQVVIYEMNRDSEIKVKNELTDREDAVWEDE